MRKDSDLPFSVALGVVALLPRLFVAIAWPREPVWDGHYYHYGATRIAAGLGYSEDVARAGQLLWKPWCHYPVGYSALLGAAYRVFGSGPVVATLLNAVIGTLLVVLVHRLSLLHLEAPRARIAGALAALHPGLIAYTAVLMTEQLAALLLVTAAIFFVGGRTRATRLVGAGVAFGVAGLVRPSALLALPVLGVVSGRPWRRALAFTGAAAAVAALVVMPWTLRNCRVMDGCALVSTNGGWNLAIGATGDSGRFHTLRASDGCPIVTGQVQQDRCWAGVGWAKIRKNPLDWLALAPKKLGHTYDHESFAIEYLREADPRTWPEARRVAGRTLLSTTHRALLVVAALGVVAWPRRETFRTRKGATQLAALALVLGLTTWAILDVRHSFFWLPVLAPLLALLPGAPSQGKVGRFLLGTLLATSLTHVLFFGDDRYHLVVTPALCILAASALRLAGRPTLSPAR